MKLYVSQSWRWMWLTVAFVKMAASVYAGPSTAEVQGGSTNVASPKLFRSTFVMPTTSREGKDPFFPKSDRPHRSGIKTGPTNSVVVAELTVNGFSGTSEKPLVIINNVTFGIGDELDVPFKGRKFRVRCTEVNITEGLVRVQIGSETRELRLQTD